VQPVLTPKRDRPHAIFHPVVIHLNAPVAHDQLESPHQPRQGTCFGLAPLYEVVGRRWLGGDTLGPQNLKRRGFVRLGADVSGGIARDLCKKMLLAPSPQLARAVSSRVPLKRRFL
jgi:hypothetical protein